MERAEVSFDLSEVEYVHLLDGKYINSIRNDIIVKDQEGNAIRFGRDELFIRTVRK